MRLGFPMACALSGILVASTFVLAAEPVSESVSSEGTAVLDEQAPQVIAGEIVRSLGAQQAGSLADLAKRFRAEQERYLWISPPLAAFTLRQECGLVVFDAKAFPAEFTRQLVGEMKHDCPLYPLTMTEDPVTREIIFMNSDKREVACIKPEADYNPYWLLEWRYPELYSGLYSAREIRELKAAYDPGRIQITVTLLPADYLEQYAAGVAADEARQVALTPTGRNAVMMRYEGPSVDELQWVGIERQTNGILLTLAYPDAFTNRVDVFTCADLVSSWWDLALDATNVNTSTHWIEWVDTAAVSQSPRFYAAGNADLDSDGDGLADARERFMYHTSPTNSDSDTDGLGDYFEIMTLNTDPNNTKTNKPLVNISYPANESRKVWIP